MMEGLSGFHAGRIDLFHHRVLDMIQIAGKTGCSHSSELLFVVFLWEVS